MAAYGLKLHKASTAPQALETCFIPATDSVIYGKGDVVKTAGSSGAIGNGPNVKTVARISAGDAMYGVIEGFDEVNVASSSFSLDRTHRPASVAMYAHVRVLNNVDEYTIYADDEGATLAVTDVGLNANITGNGGSTTITNANTTNGMSTMMLDTSTKDTTATLQLKIVGFYNDPNLSVGSTNQKVVVRANNCETSGSTGTAGV